MGLPALRVFQVPFPPSAVPWPLSRGRDQLALLPSDILILLPMLSPCPLSLAFQLAFNASAQLEPCVFCLSVPFPTSGLACSVAQLVIQQLFLPVGSCDLPEKPWPLRSESEEMLIKLQPLLCAQCVTARLL